MRSSGVGVTGLKESTKSSRDRRSAAAAVVASRRAVAAASVLRSSSGMSCKFNTDRKLEKTSSNVTVCNDGGCVGGCVGGGGVVIGDRKNMSCGCWSTAGWMMSSRFGKSSRSCSSLSSCSSSESMTGPKGTLWRKEHNTIVAQRFMSNRFTGNG
jgi:hypothetical protein